MSDVLFTSRATAKNGRDGHVKSSDGLIDLEMANPSDKKDDSKSNPEQLFAAGYAACFDGAVNLVASKKSKEIDSTTTADVSFMKDKEDGGFKIGVTLNVEIHGTNPEEANEIVQEAHKVCPYSKATRNNIEVNLNAQAVEG